MDTFLDSYGLAAAFLLVLVKSIGVPVPIPGDVILLATAAQAAHGKVSPGIAFVVLLVALVVGGIVQFGLAGGPARAFVYRHGGRIGLSQTRLDSAAAVLRKRGVIGIGLAVLTPGVRTAAIPAAGLAGVSPLTFGLGLALGSALDLALHFGIGFLGVAWLGTVATAVPLPWAIVGVLVLLAASLGVWFVLRRRAQPAANAGDILAEATAAWDGTACPVCLALGAVANRVALLQVDPGTSVATLLG